MKPILPNRQTLDKLVERGHRLDDAISAFEPYGDPEVKIGLHRRISKFLRDVAKAFGMRENSHYCLHSNLAGIAVFGETTLHADHVYIQVSKDAIAKIGNSVSPQVAAALVRSNITNALQEVAA